MADIKDIGAIADKFTRVTPTRSQDFEQGVRSPRADWATNTEEAGDSWAGGIQQAIADKRFERGVRNAGTPKWQQKTLDVGVQRWQGGVQTAGEAYQRGFAPYVDVIARTTLPPKGPKGAPQNMERAAVMARALHEAKRQMA
tara:strand:- start:573 stop:998 length:426 start_codon:yes stop_codon:yes gene_type:complete